MLSASLYSQGKHRPIVSSFMFCLNLLVLVSVVAIVQVHSTSLAQSYEGTYNELANPSNELILTFEGEGLYTGVLFEDVAIYSIQASQEDTTLKGVILKSRAGAEEDVEFQATLSEGLLTLESNSAEVIYARPGTDIPEDLLILATEVTNSTDTINASILSDIESESTALKSYPIRTGSLTGEVIQPDQQYWGGTQLQIPSVGIAFQIPSAGTALHTSPQQTVVIGHTSTLGNVSIMALSGGDFDAFVASYLKTDDDQLLNLVSGPVETEDSYRAAFELETENRTSYIEVAAQKGPSGNMVLLQAKSRLAEAEDISLVVDMLLESLVFSEVEDISLATTVANKRLTTATKIIDTCTNSEFRIDNTEASEVGLWKYASSIFSSGITMGSIQGNFYYVPLESEVGILDDEPSVLVETSPYCQ